MIFQFVEKDPVAIKDRIVAAMGGRELGKMVKFELKDKSLVVTIEKFGTSTLRFRCDPRDGGLAIELESQKIAFTHRAFEQDVKDKICKVIETVGGKRVQS